MKQILVSRKPSETIRRTPKQILLWVMRQSRLQRQRFFRRLAKASVVGNHWVAGSSPAQPTNKHRKKMSFKTHLIFFARFFTHPFKIICKFFGLFQLIFALVFSSNLIQGEYTLQSFSLSCCNFTPNIAQKQIGVIAHLSCRSHINSENHH